MTAPRFAPGTAARIADAAAACQPRPGNQATLIGISGIDASGKSTLARKVGEQLNLRNVPSAALSIDWFHTDASVRFLPPSRVHEPPESHAEHFFHHAFRWDELFTQVVNPLVTTGACDATIGLHNFKSDTITPTRIMHTGVRVVLLEGIFIFRREHANAFDSRVWLDCSFETSLARALARNQEGLPPAAIRADYERVYFPAQQFHLRRDNPINGSVIVPEGASV